MRLKRDGELFDAVVNAIEAWSPNLGESIDEDADVISAVVALAFISGEIVNNCASRRAKAELLAMAVDTLRERVEVTSAVTAQAMRVH